MQRLARLAALGCILAGGCRLSPPPPASPMEKKIAGSFDGAWIGRVSGDDEVWTLLIEEGRVYITRSGSGDWIKGTLQSRKQEILHAVDLTVTDCDCKLKGTTFAALARLSGEPLEYLEIVAGRPGEPRPETLEQPGLRRIRLRRATQQPPDGGTLTVTIGKS